MNRITLIIGTILLFVIGAFAQHPKTSPENTDIQQEKNRSGKTQNRAGSTPSSEVSDPPLLNAGTSISGQLQKTLDVKKSEVGDEVVLKVTQSIKQDGEVIVPKGTKLLGRVTEVQRKSKENPTSRLGVVFDRMEGKSLSAPFSASVVSIVESSNRVIADYLFSAGSMGSSRSTASTSGGGGLLGGGTGTVGNVVGTTTGVVGGVTSTAGSTLGSATQTLGPTLKGIQLSQSTNGTAGGSTMLSSNNKNLKIQQGVTFNLRLDQSVNANQ